MANLQQYLLYFIVSFKWWIDPKILQIWHFFINVIFQRKKMESNVKKLISAIKNIQHAYSQTSVVGSSPSRASTKTFQFSVETKTVSDILNSSSLTATDNSVDGLELGFTMLNISGIFNDSIADKPISVQVKLIFWFLYTIFELIDAKAISM